MTYGLGFGICGPAGICSFDIAWKGRPEPAHRGPPMGSRLSAQPFSGEFIFRGKGDPGSTPAIRLGPLHLHKAHGRCHQRPQRASYRQNRR